MSAPSAESQLAFLTNLQRLLAEGQFVATYKYALLLALAEIAVESGDDTGAPLVVATSQIAEKFIHYYWRQVLPYVPRPDPTMGQVLRQNTGNQAAIIPEIIRTRQRYGGSIAAAQRDVATWETLVRTVDRTVRQMPLWKLQTVGRSSFDFLYANVGQGSSIELRSGVAYCLRRFYGLVGDLVRGAWVRYIRRNNHDALGTTADLSEFLFGSERADLSAVRGVLDDVQRGRCFYCENPIRARVGHVDHFIPWSKYPLDLGHNFVFAHQSCNSAKADHLASADHLATWSDRNDRHREQLAAEFTRLGVLHDLPTSFRIAGWAYRQAHDAGGLTWEKGETMVALPIDWERFGLGLLDPGG